MNGVDTVAPDDLARVPFGRLHGRGTMRADRHTNRPWRRRHSTATDPAEVLRELNRRQLNDLEDCRLAWERADDPVAVCVAMTKCDLPEWLVDALLVLLTEPEFLPGFHRRLWPRHRQDAIDSLRAAHLAAARSHPDAPQSWEWSQRLGNHFASKEGTPSVSTGAMKKSYGKVRDRLRNPGRYYAPPKDFGSRLLLAWKRLRDHEAARSAEETGQPQQRK